MRFDAYQLNKYIYTADRKGAAHELFFGREKIILLCTAGPICGCGPLEKGDAKSHPSSVAGFCATYRTYHWRRPHAATGQ